MLEKPSRTSFKQRMDHMITSIRNDIYTGKLQEGHYLPSINQLSEIYQLSKNSVQKGLDVLVEEKLIQRIPRIGIQVLNIRKNGITTLRLGYYPSLLKDADLKHLISIFEETHPHIRISMIPLPYGDYKEAVMHYLTNDLLDIVFINDNHFQQLMEDPETAPNLFVDQQQEKSNYPFLYPSFSYKGRTFAQPFIFSPVILCYNKEHFRKNPVVHSEAWTWDQFTNSLEQFHIKSKYRYPFYFHPTSTNRWTLFLLQSGIDFSNPQKDMNVLMDGVNVCHDLLYSQSIPPALLLDTDATIEKLFAQEKISVMMTTYFGLNELKDVPFPFDLAPLPYVHEPGTLLLTIGLALNNYSTNKEAGQAFIRFMTSYKQQQWIRQNTFSLPAVKEASELKNSQLKNEPEHYFLYQELIPSYYSLADIGLQQEERQTLLNVLKYYWMGLESKETTLDKISTIFSRTNPSPT